MKNPDEGSLFLTHISKTMIKQFAYISSIINLNNNLIITSSHIMDEELHLDSIATCRSQPSLVANCICQQASAVIQGNSQECKFVLEVMCKIVKRIYSRYFMKGFGCIQALRNHDRHIIQYEKPIDINNLPFRSLLVKKQRNEDEEQMVNFLNHCATIIQSKFRSYITRKRHLLALHKAKNATNILRTLVRRWKFYRVFNCEQIVLIRSKIREITGEIEKEQNNGRDMNDKKIKVMKKYLSMQNKIFQDNFKVLMETGMWTLEKNMKIKVWRNESKKIGQNAQYRQYRSNCQNAQFRQNRQNRQYIQNTQKIQKIQKIQNKQKPQPTSQPKNPPQKYHKKQNINLNGQTQLPQKLQSNETNYSQFEDRPIQAAGQYKYNEEEQLQIRGIGEKNEKQGNEGDHEKQLKNKEKIKKYHELQKRNKYDPRKAIEEEKKRKKQNKQSEKNKSNAILPPPHPPPLPLSQTNKLKQLSKSLQKLDKQDKQDNEIIKTKKLPKLRKQKTESEIKKTNYLNSKPPTIKNITSKVDCWVNKKQQQPEWAKQYKIRLIELNKRQSQQPTQKYSTDRKSLQKIANKTLEGPIRQPQKPQQQLPSQRIQRVMTDSQKPKKKIIGVQQWQQKQKQIENLKQKQSQYVGRRKNSAENIQDQVKALIQKKNMMKKKEMHRPIEELQETYNKHYGDRFQNLMPRLSLLAVARSEEGGSRIPVIAEQGEEFNEWFEQIYSSTQFWKKAAEHEKIYKSFILP